MKELTGEQILSKHTDIDTLLTYMRDGLSAKTECGLKVYDIDDPNSGPSIRERLAAKRAHRSRGR